MSNERNLSAVPEAACRLVGGEVVFRDNGEGAKTAGVRILARSGKPIEHWYWGNVVHDLAGMRHKPRITVDYAHNDAEVLGYVNHFEVESGDLWLSGALTPWREDDRANEVMFKMRGGVPYEASIFFGGDGIKIEEVAAGQVAPVNGYQFAGPGIIVREWPLRGVAICPYGADANTESAALSGGKTYAAMAVETKETEMSEVVKPVDAKVEDEAQAVEAPAVEAEATPETPAPVALAAEPETAAPVVPTEPESVPDPRAEFKRMKADFGAEIAAEVFESGGTYENALRLSNERLRAENEILRAKIAEAKPSGGTPAAFAGGNEDDQRKRPTLRELCEKGTSKRGG